MSGHGLAVALESLAVRAVVPVRLTVDVEDRLEGARGGCVLSRLREPHERRQARRRSLNTVDVRHAGGEVVVEVVDNGVGGADTERGSGLRGLADRVEALDGRLRVWSPPGGGTRLRAEIPCAR